MKKTLQYSGLFLALAALSACYKDKGNYDYTELNELTVKGLEARYERDQDDSLNIAVDLQGTQYADTGRFTYEWEIGRRIIQSSKDLHMKVNLGIGDHLGRFVVTDKGNQAKAYFRFGLRVASATAGDLLVVLSNANGEAELSYKRLDKEGPFSVNYYRERFGESLGSGPKSICINYNSLANQVPFGDAATLGGLQVLTKEGLKVLDKNDLGPKSGLTYMTGTSFSSYLPPYPVQDVSNFNPEHVMYQVDMWNHNPYGGINQSGRLFVISNGALYFNAMSRFSSTIYVNQKIDGYLAPALCYAFVNNSQQTSATLKMRGFDVSSYMLMFDNARGSFMFSNYGGRPSLIMDKAGKELLPSYPGYKMIYASHTSNPNKCVALLHNGTQTKIVYLTVPGNATQATTMPFSVDGTVDVPGSMINESSRFYTMRYTPYLLFSTAGKVYRYNLLNVLNGTAPSDVIANLSDMGYDASATINAFTVSRTEKNLLMAVSRYGSATATDGPPKGDVVKMFFNNSAISLTFDKKFEGVSGNPADIRIKYQTHQRDGVNKDGVEVDKI